jgi:hypothetical protein
MGIRSRVQIPNRGWAGWLRLLGKIGIRVHPTDAEMIAVFGKHRQALETIQKLLHEDRKIIYLDRNEGRLHGAHDPQPYSGMGVPMERLGQYRSCMSDARVEAVSRQRETITFRVSVSGRSSKGFVYAPEEPILRNSLDDHPCTVQGHAHVSLEEEWYIYYGWWK